MAKKKPAPAQKESSPKSFEESLQQLESIVAQLETGELSMDDSLSAYERGISHLKSCHRLLKAAEKKVELLSGVDAEGNPITTPFAGDND